MRPSVLIALASLALSTPAIAGEVVIKEVSSNSVLVDRDKGITYGAQHVLTGKASEMWVEGESSSGLGKYLEVKFDGAQEIHSFRIWAGCFVDADFWKRHNRVALVEFKYPDFTSEKFEIADVMAPQTLKLAAPKNVDKVKIYLRSVHNGTTWNDTPITRLQFFDAAGPSDLSGLKATATSEYEDKEHTYAPSKAVDGWDDTYWVNGPGDGTGESLDIDLGGTQSIKQFGIATGFGDTKSFFDGSNRAAEVRLDFSDGTSKTFALEDVAALQTFHVEATASRVKVTVTRVTRGTAHDDLYIGEVRFWK